MRPSNQSCLSKSMQIEIEGGGTVHITHLPFQLSGVESTSKAAFYVEECINKFSPKLVGLEVL